MPDAERRGLEDYGSRIRRPMDLGTVLNNLKSEQYRNPHLCRLDVIQVLECPWLAACALYLLPPCSSPAKLPEGDLLAVVGE